MSLLRTAVPVSVQEVYAYVEARKTFIRAFLENCFPFHVHVWYPFQVNIRVKCGAGSKFIFSIWISKRSAGLSQKSILAP